MGLIASLFVERMDAGISLRDMLDDIEVSVVGRPELALKLRDGVASALGASITAGLLTSFDAHLAETSLLLFDANTVPAVRGDLPAYVSDVHFRTDLSGSRPTAMDSLGDTTLRRALSPRLL
jgi:hypothetical protein